MEIGFVFISDALVSVLGIVLICAVPKRDVAVLISLKGYVRSIKTLVRCVIRAGFIRLGRGNGNNVDTYEKKRQALTLLLCQTESLAHIIKEGNENNIKKDEKEILSGLKVQAFFEGLFVLLVYKHKVLELCDKGEKKIREVLKKRIHHEKAANLYVREKHGHFQASNNFYVI